MLRLAISYSLLFHRMLLQLLLCEADVEIIFELDQVGLGDENVVTALDDRMDVSGVEGPLVAHVFSEELANCHHAVHLQNAALKEVVQEGNTDAVDVRPAVDQEQIEYRNEHVLGQEARKQRHAPLEGEVLSLHFDAAEVREQLGAELRDGLVERKIHDGEFREALHEHALHFQAFISQKMKENHEGNMLFVLGD